MADCALRISEVSFIILAVSTLAWAAIIVAYDNRRWMAADCMFFCVYGCKIKSESVLYYLWWRCALYKDPMDRSFLWRKPTVRLRSFLDVPVVLGKNFIQQLISRQRRTFLWWTIWFFGCRSWACIPVCRAEWLGSKQLFECSCWRCLWWWLAEVPGQIH